MKLEHQASPNSHLSLQAITCLSFVTSTRSSECLSPTWRWRRDDSETQGGWRWTWQRSTFQLKARRNMAAPDRLPAPQLWAPNYSRSIRPENTARTDWSKAQINTRKRRQEHKDILTYTLIHTMYIRTHTHTHRYGLIHPWQPEAWLIWLARYFRSAYKMYLQP